MKLITRQIIIYLMWKYPKYVKGHWEIAKHYKEEKNAKRYRVELERLITWGEIDEDSKEGFILNPNTPNFQTFIALLELFGDDIKEAIEKNEGFIVDFILSPKKKTTAECLNEILKFKEYFIKSGTGDKFLKRLQNKQLKKLGMKYKL